MPTFPELIDHPEFQKLDDEGQNKAIQSLKSGFADEIPESFGPIERARVFGDIGRYEEAVRLRQEVRSDEAGLAEQQSRQQNPQSAEFTPLGGAARQIADQNVDFVTTVSSRIEKNRAKADRLLAVPGIRKQRKQDFERIRTTTESALAKLDPDLSLDDFLELSPDERAKRVRDPIFNLQMPSENGDAFQTTRPITVEESDQIQEDLLESARALETLGLAEDTVSTLVFKTFADRETPLISMATDPRNVMRAGMKESLKNLPDRVRDAEQLEEVVALAGDLAPELDFDDSFLGDASNRFKQSVRKFGSGAARGVQQPFTLASDRLATRLNLERQFETLQNDQIDAPDDLNKTLGGRATKIAIDSSPYMASLFAGPAGAGMVIADFADQEIGRLEEAEAESGAGRSRAEIIGQGTAVGAAQFAIERFLGVTGKASPISNAVNDAVKRGTTSRLGAVARGTGRGIKGLPSTAAGEMADELGQELTPLIADAAAETLADDRFDKEHWKTQLKAFAEMAPEMMIAMTAMSAISIPGTIVAEVEAQSAAQELLANEALLRIRGISPPAAQEIASEPDPERQLAQFQAEDAKADPESEEAIEAREEVAEQREEMLTALDNSEETTSEQEAEQSSSTDVPRGTLEQLDSDIDSLEIEGVSQADFSTPREALTEQLEALEARERIESGSGSMQDARLLAKREGSAAAEVFNQVAENDQDRGALGEIALTADRSGSTLRPRAAVLEQMGLANADVAKLRNILGVSPETTQAEDVSTKSESGDLSPIDSLILERAGKLTDEKTGEPLSDQATLAEFGEIREAIEKANSIEKPTLRRSALRRAASRARNLGLNLNLKDLENAVPMSSETPGQKSNRPNKAAGGPPQKDSGSAPQLKKALANDDLQEALKILRGLPKQKDIEKALREIGYGAVYNAKSKNDLIKRFEGDASGEGQTFFFGSELKRRQSKARIQRAEKELSDAKDKQQRHLDGILGMPTDENSLREISNEEGRDPHGIGREKVAAAWARIVADAKADLERVLAQESKPEAKSDKPIQPKRGNRKPRPKESEPEVKAIETPNLDNTRARRLATAADQARELIDALPEGVDGGGESRLESVLTMFSRGQTQTLEQQEFIREKFKDLDRHAENFDKEQEKLFWIAREEGERLGLLRPYIRGVAQAMGFESVSTIEELDAAIQKIENPRERMIATKDAIAQLDDDTRASRDWLAENLTGVRQVEGPDFAYETEGPELPGLKVKWKDGDAWASRPRSNRKTIAKAVEEFVADGPLKIQSLIKNIGAEPASADSIPEAVEQAVEGLKFGEIREALKGTTLENTTGRGRKGLIQNITETLRSSRQNLDQISLIGSNENVAASPTPIPNDSGFGEALEISRETYGSPAQPKGPNSIRQKPTTPRVRPISAPEVIDSLRAVQSEVDSVSPIRVGNLKNPKEHAGEYQVGPEVVRLREANDLPTLAHEIAHDLEKHIWGDDGIGNQIDATISDELENLGLALYGNTVPAAGYTSEGFAEFVRIYLENFSAAQKAAPEMTFWFEQFLKAKPRLARAVLNARKAFERFEEQGALGRADQGIVGNESISRKAKAKAQMLAKGMRLGAEQMIESGRSLAAIDKQIKKEAGQPSDIYDTFKSLRRTADGVAAYFVEKATTDIAGNVNGGSLEQAVAPVKGKMQDFLKYLWARRAIALYSENRVNAQGEKIVRNPGLSKADATAIVNHYETRRDGHKFQLAAENLYQWNERVLDYMAESSPEFARAVDAIRNADPGDYIPLHREFEQLDSNWRSDSNSSAKSATIAKRLKGSGRRIKNPIESMILTTRSKIQAAHERLILDKILRAATTVEGLGNWIAEVPAATVPAASRSYENLIETMTKTIEDAGGTIDIDAGNLDLAKEMATFFTRGAPKRGETPILSIIKDGKPRYFEINPLVFETLEGLRPPELNASLEKALWVFRATARTSRLGTTGLRAAFSMITNPLRDIQTAFFNSRAMDNPLMALTGFLREYTMGALDALSGGKIKTEWSDLFDRLGGGLAQPITQDTNFSKRAGRRLFQSRIRKITDVRNVYDFIANAFQFPEKAARILEMKALAKKLGWDGKSPLSAEQSHQILLAAKEVSTDFSAAGRTGALVNQYVPFFNAAIQGPRASLRAAKKRPAAVALKGIGLIGMALGAWWKIKDEDWWEEMPSDERYRFTYAKVGDQILRIPRPFEVGGITMALPEAIADATYQWAKEDPADPERKYALDWLESFVSHTTPPTLPPIFALRDDLLANKDHFFGKPIIPKSLEGKSPEKQFQPWTTDVARFLGKLTDKSPLEIDHSIKKLFGPAATDYLGILGDSYEGEEGRAPSDLPVLGTLFMRDQYPSQSVSVTKFYDAIKEAEIRLEDGEETPEQRLFRLGLNDAKRAMSALGEAYRESKGDAGRRAQIARKKSALARAALEGDFTRNSKNSGAPKKLKVEDPRKRVENFKVEF